MDELRQLKRVSEVALLFSVVVTSLFLGFALVARSGSLLLYFAWALAAILVKVFSLIALRIMLKQNEYLFPNGTGKIENFSAFLFGVSIAPPGFYFLFASVRNLLAPPAPVAYGLCLIPMALALTCSTILSLWLGKIVGMQTEPAPLLHATRANVRISLISDTFILAAFVLGGALRQAHLEALGAKVDPLLSLFLAAVMVKSGTALIVDNLRALLDLPLPEKEMMPILRVLAEFVDVYQDLGQLRTRRSGRCRIVELELVFAPGVPLEQVREVERRMAERLLLDLPDSTLTVRPKLLPAPGG